MPFIPFAHQAARLNRPPSQDPRVKPEDDTKGTEDLLETNALPEILGSALRLSEDDTKGDRGWQRRKAGGQKKWNRGEGTARRSPSPLICHPRA